MKKLLSCLSLALVVGCVKAPEAPPPARAKTMSVETLRAQSVALVQQPRGLMALFTGGMPRVFCSGVWVSPTSVLTADHCVDQEDEETEAVIKDYEITTADDVQDPTTGKQYKNVATYSAHVYARDYNHDLALLHVSAAPAHPFATVALGTVRQGDKVFNMGQSEGLWFSFGAGTVSARREEELANDAPKPAFQIQTTVPTSPGNSGGALFNEAGEIVGICHAKVMSRGAENLAFYIDTSYVRAFLDAQGDRL